ncbi:MAG: hypothetical protein E7108_02550 [Bacteroidales bacterium]|nr:hypothetical protein [Bacteroidales bacterium]
MGILFTFVFWLIILAILSAFLGLIVMFIIRLCCKKEKRKRKMVLGFFSPGIALGTYTISSFIAMIIIAIILDIDIGIGDGWRGKLPNGYHLYSIDMPENGAIVKQNSSGTIFNDDITVNGITNVAVSEEYVFGFINYKERVEVENIGKYFALDTKTGEISYFDSEEELVQEYNLEELVLQDNNSFYWSQRRIAYIIASIVCLTIAVIAVFLFWKGGLWGIGKLKK